jgi:hypothetical protein
VNGVRRGGWRRSPLVRSGIPLFALIIGGSVVLSIVSTAQ